MSSVTPIFRLNLIAFDTQPWDVAMNANISTIDAIMARYISILNLGGIWTNGTTYTATQQVIDPVDSSLWVCNVGNTSAASPTLFSADRTNNPTWWTLVNTQANAQASATAAAASAASAAATIAAGVTAAAASATAAAASANTALVNSIGVKNKLHNSLFNIQQRGAGPFTANNAYTLDRWMMVQSTSTNSVTPLALSDADRTAIGDEEAINGMQCVFAGSGGAADFAQVVQRIENVRRLSGKQIALSFWAKATTGTPKIGFDLIQSFGTGGSPSANVSSIGSGATIALTTTITRYTAVINVPTVVGKTFGTTLGTDFTQLNFWLSSGATNNAEAGSIGVQSGTVVFWGMQLEVDSVSTALEKVDPQMDLAKCQRFAAPLRVTLQAPVAGDLGASFYFPVPMRATPTFVNIAAGTLTSATIVTELARDNATFNFAIDATAANGSVSDRINFFSADL